MCQYAEAGGIAEHSIVTVAVEGGKPECRTHDQRNSMPNLTQLVRSPNNPVVEFCRAEMLSKVAAHTANRMLSGFETAVPEVGFDSYP